MLGEIVPTTFETVTEDAAIATEKRVQGSVRRSSDTIESANDSLPLAPREAAREESERATLPDAVDKSPDNDDVFTFNEPIPDY